MAFQDASKPAWNVWKGMPEIDFKGAGVVETPFFKNSSNEGDLNERAQPKRAYKMSPSRRRMFGEITFIDFS